MMCCRQVWDTLNGTKLPIGGESTHCVVAAHRGLPSAKLFTDIDQLRNGDKFYIHVLDQVLAYEVDQILPMVDKDDHETLENALKIEEGKGSGHIIYLYTVWCQFPQTPCQGNESGLQR